MCRKQHSWCLTNEVCALFSSGCSLVLCSGRCHLRLLGGLESLIWTCAGQPKLVKKKSCYSSTWSRIRDNRSSSCTQKGQKPSISLVGTGVNTVQMFQGDLKWLRKHPSLSFLFFLGFAFHPLLFLQPSLRPPIDSVPTLTRRHQQGATSAETRNGSHIYERAIVSG